MMAIAGAILSPVLIPILYGEDFSGSVVPFEILICGIVFACQTKIFASFILSDNKVKINLMATIVGFILACVFNFTLIPIYGITGASIAQSISAIGVFLFVYIASLIFTKIGRPNLFILTSQDIQYARARFKRKN
jgi:O-antigen/teichoic acid export membrane protein